MNDSHSVQATGRRWIVSVFGDITRRGSWPTRDHMSPVAVFGDIDLDFRQATIPAGNVAINAVAPFGNIEVLVPDGVQVDVGGFTLFGSKKIAVETDTANESADGDPGAGFQPFRKLQSAELVNLKGLRSSTSSASEVLQSGPPRQRPRFASQRELVRFVATFRVTPTSGRTLGGLCSVVTWSGRRVDVDRQRGRRTRVRARALGAHAHRTCTGDISDTDA